MASSTNLIIEPAGPGNRQVPPKVPLEADIVN